MSFEVLEINRFSTSGEVLRKIRCLAGRVSVFRSHSETDLEKFKTALQGKTQEERFSVLVDGTQFNPKKNVFIGFGDLDEQPSARSIANYLADVGISQDKIESLLLLYGLGGLSQSSCSELQPSQWSTLRLVRILNAPEFNWVVALHEPFQDIPEQFRESLAGQVTQCAWEKHGIIIVTKLSYRPQCWIENEHIARIQLERPRQGTIGFGGGELSTPEAIYNLRKEMGVADPAPAPEKSASPVIGGQLDLLAAKPSANKWNFNRKQSAIALFATFALLLSFGVYRSITEYKNSEVALLSDTATVAEVAPPTQSDNVTPQEQLKADPVQPKNPVVEPPKHIGEIFPEEIRVAWSKAVNDPGAVIKESLEAAAPLTAHDSNADTSNEQWSREEQVELPEELSQLKDEIQKDPGL